MATQWEILGQNIRYPQQPDLHILKRRHATIRLRMLWRIPCACLAVYAWLARPLAFASVRRRPGLFRNL